MPDAPSTCAVRKANNALYLFSLQIKPSTFKYRSVSYFYVSSRAILHALLAFNQRRFTIGTIFETRQSRTNFLQLKNKIYISFQLK